ncbi:hypothetical protein VM1G_11775 [Cytospora mali]|uniref:Uncharacterized protein n=1 Tax=Cytospora mali TaxID=578113 RepID=A0A194W526_CYTMA|nr:hypothetical protein VM1G_11775 [Valsa mali]
MTFNPGKLHTENGKQAPPGKVQVRGRLLTQAAWHLSNWPRFQALCLGPSNDVGPTMTALFGRIWKSLTKNPHLRKQPHDSPAFLQTKVMIAYVRCKLRISIVRPSDPRTWRPDYVLRHTMTLGR